MHSPSSDLVARPRPAVGALIAVLVLAACGATQPSSPSPSASSSAPADAPRPVIIDTDLDVSDVVAVETLLLDPGVDVRALTIVPTGTGVTNCASGRAVAAYLLQQLGRESVPYACGRTDAGADALPFPPEWRTAADVGWGIDMPPSAGTATPPAATDVLAEAIAGSATPPTIVALGPWTNLEDAFAADPSLVGSVAGIHAMAGAIDTTGNVFVDGFDGDDRLEWNVVADPSAFRAVFDLDVPLAIVPLDATDDVPVSPDLAQRLADAGAFAGTNLAYELMVRVPSRVGEGQQLWDELAALAFLEPDLVTWEEMVLEAATPEGRLDRTSEGRPVRVATAADAGQAEAALLGALARGPGRAQPFALSGSLSVTWDGSSCETDGDGLEPGIASLTLDNQTDAPVALAVIGISAPHTWDELTTLLEDPQLLETEPPEWILQLAYLSDDEGTGGERAGTTQVIDGIVGAVCATGEWPDLAFVPGEPVTIGP